MYMYEMHCHTSECSKCARASAAEQVDFYKGLGFSGLVISDHFLNGNTVIDPTLPWKQKIELFTVSYENARERGAQVGLDVFFAWENSYKGTDFLTYGLDKQWLLSHPDCDKISVSEYCDIVHESGGFIVQAHPFREARYIEMIRLLPRKVDAVETVNAKRTDFENRMADNYAENYSLTKFCGGDNHNPAAQERVAALELNIKAQNIQEIINEVRLNRHNIALYDVSCQDGGYKII